MEKDLSLRFMLQQKDGVNKMTYNLKEQQDYIEELEVKKDNAYSERNRLVAALTKLFPAWIEWHSEEDNSWDNDWRNIIYIDLPAGQVSWHIHKSEVEQFYHLKMKEGKSSWDGHTTEEKYKRLAELPDYQKLKFSTQKKY